MHLFCIFLTAFRMPDCMAVGEYLVLFKAKERTDAVTGLLDLGDRRKRPLSMVDCQLWTMRL